MESNSSMGLTPEKTAMDTATGPFGDGADSKDMTFLPGTYKALAIGNVKATPGYDSTYVP